MDFVNAKAKEDSEEDDDESEDEPIDKSPVKRSAPSSRKPPAKKKKSNNDDDDDDDAANGIDDDDTSRTRKGKKSKPRKKNKKELDEKGDDGAKKKSGQGKGYLKSCKLSPDLASLMGEDSMPRHAVVKKVWQIIKEQNLYDPKNKQFAICSPELQKVMGVKRFRTFGMLKHLRDHFIDD